MLAIDLQYLPQLLYCQVFKWLNSYILVSMYSVLVFSVDQHLDKWDTSQPENADDIFGLALQTTFSVTATNQW